MLVAGSVIIGRREEGKEIGAVGTGAAEPEVGSPAATYTDEPDAPPPSVGRSDPLAVGRHGAYEDHSDIELETANSN